MLQSKFEIRHSLEYVGTLQNAKKLISHIHGFNGRGFNCQFLDNFGLIFWALGILKEFYSIFEIRHGSSCNNATTMVQLCNGKCRDKQNRMIAIYENNKKEQIVYNIYV
ncbi:UNVERIFIED_CONTAM: hypothetical protein NCL1_18219 [Trichonephila clavipes]